MPIQFLGVRYNVFLGTWKKIDPIGGKNSNAFLYFYFFLQRKDTRLVCKVLGSSPNFVANSMNDCRPHCAHIKMRKF